MILKTLTDKNGAYTLSHLIKLYDVKKNYVMRYVSDNKDLTFENELYKSGTFNYTLNTGENGFDGGGKLEISTIDNFVIDLIESSKLCTLEVIQILNENGNISVLRKAKHKYCKPSVERGKAVFTFEKDDRQTMTFPTMIFSTINNRGN